MQRPDQAKRQAILNAAAELFSQRPFHEVRLDDVAAAARIGKGTVYIYFKNKDDLYLSLIREGFQKLVDRLNAQIEAEETTDAWATLSLIVRELVDWATQHPQLFQLMRAVQPKGPDIGFKESRRQLGKLIESVIRQGVRKGELHDPHPELTAQLIPAFVRGALVHGPKEISRQMLSRQVLRVLGQGIRRNGR